MNRMRTWGAWVSLALGVLPVYAGEVVIGAPAVEENRLTFPISLRGDVAGGVSALDFRFNYDAAMFKPVSVGAGEAAVSADKRIEWNVCTPGECIVVMMGMNQTPCQTGKVAEIVLQRLGSPGEGDYEFAVSRPTLSSTEGNIIPAEGSEETVTFPAAGSTDDSGTDGTTPSDGTPASRGETDAEDRPVGSLAERARTASSPGSPSLFRDAADGTAPTGMRADATRQGRRPGHALRGLLDKRRLAAIDKIRAGLPTPEGAPKTATGEAAPAEEHIAPVQAGSDGPAGSVIGTKSPAKGGDRDAHGGTVESDERNPSTARLAERGGERSTAGIALRTWALLGGASAIVLAVLVAARARWFT